MNFIRDYNKSLVIALECRNIWKDYYLEMLISDIYSNLLEFNMAEKTLKQASLMCPHRFLPLYKLMCLYQAIGQNAQAIDVAHQIISKPIKIRSSTVTQIVNSAKEFIKK